jgi:hypothetical protein
MELVIPDTPGGDQACVELKPTWHKCMMLDLTEQQSMDPSVHIQGKRRERCVRFWLTALGAAESGRLAA